MRASGGCATSRERCLVSHWTPAAMFAGSSYVLLKANSVLVTASAPRIVIARATTRQRRDAGVKGDVELTVTRHRRMTVLADHTRSAVTADRERTARPGMLRATRRARCDSTVPGRGRSARARNRIHR